MLRSIMDNIKIYSECCELCETLYSANLCIVPSLIFLPRFSKFCPAWCRLLVD